VGVQLCSGGTPLGSFQTVSRAIDIIMTICKIMTLCMERHVHMTLCLKVIGQLPYSKQSPIAATFRAEELAPAVMSCLLLDPTLWEIFPLRFYITQGFVV